MMVAQGRMSALSRTRKDSRKQQGTVVEVIKVGDDSFDLLLNHEFVRRSAPRDALPEWLCVKFGFCGDEFEAILREIEKEGKMVITL
jgi:hypothetical protein